MPYILFFLFLIFPWSAYGSIQTQAVEYRHGQTTLAGFLAYDDAREGKRPGILIIHEWKGFGDYVKMRAQKLAELGYVAFALDMYGKGVFAKNHEEAGALSGIYFNDRVLMRSRALAGLEVLKNQEIVDTGKLAAIGYCFGGAAVLELARAGTDLSAVVSFHGSLKTPMPSGPGDIKAKILVMHGADDGFIKPEQIAAFQEEMRRSGADWQMIMFGDAVHGFTVPEAGSDKSTGVAYNEKADKRSWTLMQSFFSEIFNSG